MERRRSFASNVRVNGREEAPMTGTPTHAIIVRVTFEPGTEEAATKLLNTEVVPGAKAAAGFVAGYWMHAPDRLTGASVELFDGLAAAQAEVSRRSAGMLPPGAPVKIDSAEITEVAAGA
jgi:hypothetical protein